MSIAGDSHKKRKAAVRKESAETQEYKSCQQNDVEVHREQGMEELRFFLGAVSDTAGWHKARFMCDRRCMGEGFKFHHIAAILVGDERRPHTINLCKNCYNLRLEVRNETAMLDERP